jgi:hypothetical protein
MSRGSFKQSSKSLYPSTSIGQTIPSNQGYEDEFALQPEIFMNNSDEPNKVIVVDLQMPFFSIVILMVKWALASIPAIIILATIFSLVTGFMGGMMGGMMHPI